MPLFFFTCNEVKNTKKGSLPKSFSYLFWGPFAKSYPHGSNYSVALLPGVTNNKKVNCHKHHPNLCLWILEGKGCTCSKPQKDNKNRQNLGLNPEPPRCGVGANNKVPAERKRSCHPQSDGVGAILSSSSSLTSVHLF